MTELYGVKNRETREYRRLEADSSEDARRLTGWPESDVLYTMQLTTSKPPMRAEVKEKLRELSALRRAVRGPKAEGRGDEGSIDMAKGATAALQAAREKKATTKVEKPKTKKKATKEKKKNEKKNDDTAADVVVTERNPSASAVVRWMGDQGFNLVQASQAMAKVKFYDGALNENTIKRQLLIGKNKEKGRGAPAKLTPEQAAQLTLFKEKETT